MSEEPQVTPGYVRGNYEVRGSVRLSWEYPNIYPDKPLDRLTIGLSHTRGANCFTVEFDGDRNGYVIRMDRVRDDDGIMETVEEGVEVAFLPAYLEDE